MLKCHGTPASAVDERAICQWNQGPWQRPCWQSRNWDSKCKYVWLGSFDLFSTAHHETAIDPGVPCKDVVPCRCESDLATRCFNLSWKHITCTSKTLDIACAWSSWSALHALNFPLTSYFAALWSSLGAWTDSVCSLPALVYRHLVDAQQNMCHNWRKCDAMGRAVWVRSGNGPDTLSDRNSDKFWLDVLSQRRMFPLYYSFIFLIILHMIKTDQNTSRLHHQNHSQIGRPHAITCLQDPTGSLQISRLKLSTWRHLVLRRINVLRFSTFVGSPTCVNTLQDITRCYKYLSYLSCSIICKCSMMNIMRTNIHVIHASFRRSESVGKLGTETLLRFAGASRNDRFGKYVASA